jgi:DNA repair exonuclease SbcCD ATPase subunit
MITFKTVKFKNFLSFGNQFTEIDLNTHHNTCLVGKNASGKSSFMDAITYALFNKAYRPINKPQLINSVNEKECLVEIEFAVGDIEWKVRRGQKPAIFEIYRNDELLDQSSSAIDQQRWFEQTVLKMNYKSFTQIVILGNSNFIPFMQLPAASRREVIEDLLDIKIFSSMNTVVKEKIKSIKDEVKILQIKKDSFFDKVKMQTDFIKKIEQEGTSQIEERNEKIQKLISFSSLTEQENQKLLEESENLNGDLEKIGESTGKLKKLGTLKGKLSQKLSTITADRNFFLDNSVCPTCTQQITEELKEKKTEEYKDTIEELETAYEKLKDTIQEEEEREQKFSKLSKELLEVNHKISQNNLKASQAKNQIKDLESEIKKIEEKIKNKNLEHEKLKSFESDLLDAKEEYIDKKEKIQYYEYIHSLLKDNGVKSKIIRKYLPLINQNVNKYLQMMDFYVNFTLDQEFNEQIKTPVYEDFSYNSFSEGQKQRINLALLFSWRELAKIKNSTNVNLLILDEIFDSSLDSSGIDDFLKIIRYVVKDFNIFVISHKDGIQDKFDNVIEFEKRGNFSFLSRM